MFNFMGFACITHYNSQIALLKTRLAYQAWSKPLIMASSLVSSEVHMQKCAQYAIKQ